VSVHWRGLDFPDLVGNCRVGFCVRSTISLVPKSPCHAKTQRFQEGPTLEAAPR
jgi:hypothetical protein